tara:strand:- start:3679 stop:4059 length:381 start_codon:yes stop_codon:yes gene_type:complete
MQHYILNRTKLLDFINQIGNRIFSLSWTKKDGTERHANVRRKVTKYLCGGKPPANTHSFIAVYLMPRMTGHTFLHESGYRLVNLETVHDIKVNGKTFTITPDAIDLTMDLGHTAEEIDDNLIHLKA